MSRDHYQRTTDDGRRPQKARATLHHTTTTTDARRTTRGWIRRRGAQDAPTADAAARREHTPTGNERPRLPSGARRHKGSHDDNRRLPQGERHREGGRQPQGHNIGRQCATRDAITKAASSHSFQTLEADHGFAGGCQGPVASSLRDDSELRWAALLGWRAGPGDDGFRRGFHCAGVVLLGCTSSVRPAASVPNSGFQLFGPPASHTHF